MIFDFENWEKPSPEEMARFFDRKSKPNGAPTDSIPVYCKHLSPLDVYKYRFARFGAPNGFQTFIKNA